MCISQSTLDSIETSQDDKVRISLIRLKDWVWQNYDHDIIFLLQQFMFAWMYFLLDLINCSIMILQTQIC